jgi:hypothetical protein
VRAVPEPDCGQFKMRYFSMSLKLSLILACLTVMITLTVKKEESHIMFISVFPELPMVLKIELLSQDDESGCGFLLLKGMYVYC